MFSFFFNLKEGKTAPGWGLTQAFPQPTWGITSDWLRFSACSLPHRAHRWCPQHYMGRAKRALIKGFDQKKTHHLPSSPPFGTRWIRGQNDAGQVSDKTRRFAQNIHSNDLSKQEQKMWAGGRLVPSEGAGSLCLTTQHIWVMMKYTLIPFVIWMTDFFF